MQSQPHWLRLKQQAKSMRLHGISGYSTGSKIIISIVTILPEKSQRTRVRKQPCVPNHAVRRAWGHHGDELPWADTNLPSRYPQPFKAMWKKPFCVKYPPPCLLRPSYAHLLTLSPCSHHKGTPAPPSRAFTGSQGIQGCFGSRCILYRPETAANNVRRCLTIFSRCETRWDRVWFCHCRDWILGLWFWASNPIWIKSVYFMILNILVMGKLIFCPALPPSFLKIPPT